jgi:hypothetical protein
MKIFLLLKTRDDKFEIKLYNQDMTFLTDTEESFDDLYTLNFYLQALQKKYNFYETLIIMHDIPQNKVKLFKFNGEIFLE